MGSRATPSPPAARSHIDTVDGRWPRTRYDAAGTAAAPDAVAPAGCPRTQWRFEIDLDFQEDISYTSAMYRLRGAPIVADRTVFVVDSEHSLYALDAATGQRR